MADKIVPDTSIVINGRLSWLIESGELTGHEIIIPLAVIDELQAQASKGRDVGFKGLEEVKKIRELAEKHGITIRLSGEKPSIEDIKLAKSGRIDALIKDVAKKEDGILYTSDYVQALVAEVEGIRVKYIEPYEKVEKFPFERYLVPNIYSLHFKTGSPPYGKQLRNGNLQIVKLGEELCTEEDLNMIIDSFSAALRVGEGYDVTLLKTGATVIESDDYRISVAKPPFSDSLEVTIQINPLKYLIKEEVFETIIHEASKFRRGIIMVNHDRVYTYPIAKLLARQLWECGNIVKIIGYSRRSPTSDAATYYGPLDGDLEKAIEFLLLSGVDYAILDEIRRSRDLKLIQELREAGLGVIAFMAADDISACLKRVIESIGLTALPKMIEIFACIGVGGLKLYHVNSEIRVPTGLSPTNPSRPIIALSRDDKIVMEAFEIEGRIVIQELDDVVKRLNILKASLLRVMGKIRKIDRQARLKSVGLDRVVIGVSASKLPKLLELAPTLTAEIGFTLEFTA
ncbi:MAG: hypothetical protein NZ918_04890 [Aigarchaeota archaeon]|nr:hypothetical protein [Aigarchaeota archaeon]